MAGSPPGEHPWAAKGLPRDSQQAGETPTEAHIHLSHVITHQAPGASKERQKVMPEVSYRQGRTSPSSRKEDQLFYMGHHEPSPPQDISGKILLARTAKHRSHHRTRRTSGHMVGRVSHGTATQSKVPLHPPHHGGGQVTGGWDTRDKARLGQCRPQPSLQSDPRASPR